MYKNRERERERARGTGRNGSKVTQVGMRDGGKTGNRSRIKVCVETKRMSNEKRGGSYRDRGNKKRKGATGP